MYEGPLQDLIDALGSLPGIGPKSAQRIAFWLLEQNEGEVNHIADTIRNTRSKVHFCTVCFNVSEHELCRVCMSLTRDRSKICVVEESKDVVAIERTHEFRGLYHVLGGAISPIDGRGPDALHVRELVQRLGDGAVTEIILATNPTISGDATASYLMRLLSTFPDVKLTRLASGLPVGGDLEYADEVTLGRAFAGRTSL
ncbi:MAG: recombination mediator RecR [Propionibacteriaceae bacterium]|jgi:recombination protein RecR|nr:recombination mediator RecR [Propionibacteriaceae bacterium]